MEGGGGGDIHIDRRISMVVCYVSPIDIFRGAYFWHKVFDKTSRVRDAENDLYIPMDVTVFIFAAMCVTLMHTIRVNFL